MRLVGYLKRKVTATLFHVPTTNKSYCVRGTE